MNCYLKISITLSTIWAVLIGLMARSFNAPVLVCSLATWLLSFVLCWLIFGLCNSAGHADEKRGYK